MAQPATSRLDLFEPPVRPGPRPATTGREIPHDQMDQFSPSRIRDALVNAAAALPGVFISSSQVSEPSSLALRLQDPRGPQDAFLLPGIDEFGHIHRSGFLHLCLPAALVDSLNRAGWTEMHPITRRPEFPDTIVMFYAPRDEFDLTVAVAAVRASWRRAAAVTEGN